MYTASLPESWEIEEVERMRRIRQSEVGERATIPLVPMADPTRGEREPGVERRVVVIDLW
jgi:hypothetical protein